MVFPEPSMLKPCLTSWVTPFQTLQLHEKSFRTCGHRELKLVPTSLNSLNMSQPHDCCLKRKDIAGENIATSILPPCHLGVGPLESEGFPSPEVRACITCEGLTWCFLSHQC